MVREWITSKLTIALGIILASALAVAAFQSWRVGEYREKLDASETALRASQEEVKQLTKVRAADTSAVLVQQNTKTAIAAKEVKDRAETIKALEANPDWANQPIPRDVLDSLRP